MAECTQEVVVTNNGNGSYTLANNNPVPMTATVTTSPVPSWSPLTIPANDSATVTVAHPGGANTFCWSLSTDCEGDVVNPICGIEITSITLDPDQSEYTFGQEVDVTVIATNTGNTPIDDFTVDLVHPTFEPRACCPTEPITDLVNFTMMWKHEELPSGVTQVNADGVITINGVAYDIGPSTAYTAGQSTPFSATYDVSNILPPGPYSGPAIFGIEYWYNGVVNPQPMEVDGEPGFYECNIQLNY